MSKIKCVFSVLIVLSLSACLKVQKKSDVEKVDNQEAAQEQTQPVAPVVFELNDVMSLTQDTIIIADKVILGPSARIYTNQFELTIQATILDSAIGAVIQSFSEENLIAFAETVGLSGGLVKIKTTEAYGNLQVHMNGQQGGNGKTGWKTVKTGNIYIDDTNYGECQPNSGSNSGNSGSFFFESESAQQLFITSSMKVAVGGIMGEIISNPVYAKDIGYYPKEPHKHKFPRRENCYNKPADGVPGAPGQICIKLSAEASPACEKF